MKDKVAVVLAAIVDVILITIIVLGLRGVFNPIYPPELPLVPSPGVHYAETYLAVTGHQSPLVADVRSFFCLTRSGSCQIFLYNMEILRNEVDRQLIRTLRFLHEEEVAGRARY